MTDSRLPVKFPGDVTCTIDGPFRLELRDGALYVVADADSVSHTVAVTKPGADSNGRTINPTMRIALHVLSYNARRNDPTPRKITSLSEITTFSFQSLCELLNMSIFEKPGSEEPVVRYINKLLDVVFREG